MNVVWNKIIMDTGITNIIYLTCIVFTAVFLLLTIPINELHVFVVEQIIREVSLNCASTILMLIFITACSH